MRRSGSSGKSSCERGSERRPHQAPLGVNFDPLTLFAAGGKGWWIDPSDISTMFQDTTGLTPVTATGQTVGKILDKSGNGKHWVAPSDSARPVYTVSGNQKYLVFDGTDDMFNMTLGLSNGAAELNSIVAITITAGGTRSIFRFSWNGGTAAWRFRLQNSAGITSRMRYDGIAEVVTGTTADPLNLPLVFAARANPNTLTSVWTDLTKGTDSPAPATPHTTFPATDEDATGGCDYASGGTVWLKHNFFGGVWTREMTDANRVSMTKLLASKQGRAI